MDVSILVTLLIILTQLVCMLWIADKIEHSKYYLTIPVPIFPIILFLPLIITIVIAAILVI